MTIDEVFDEAQRTKLEQMGAEWQAIASSCQPADRERAEQAVIDLYAKNKLPAPRFVWVDSPEGAIKAANEEKVHRRSSLWQELHLPSFDYYVSEKQSAKFDEKQYGDDYNARHAFRAAMREFINETFKFAFPTGAFVDSPHLLRDRTGLNFGYRRLGEVPAHAIGSALFARDVLGSQVQNGDALDIYADICRSIWFWWPYRDVCFLCERPKSGEGVDGVLHCATGPALVFRDGWSVWAINGKVVSEPGAGAAA